MENEYIEKICERIVRRLGITPGNPDFERALAQFLPVSMIPDLSVSDLPGVGKHTTHDVMYSYECMNEDGVTTGVEWETDQEIVDYTPPSAYLSSLFNDFVDEGPVDDEAHAFVQDISQTALGLENPECQVTIYTGSRYDCATLDMNGNITEETLDHDLETSTEMLTFVGLPGLCSAVRFDVFSHKGEDAYNKWKEDQERKLVSASEAKVIRREALSSSMAPAMLFDLSDTEHLIRAVGCAPDRSGAMHPLPTQVMTSSGFGPRRGFIGRQPVLDKNFIVTVPVAAGYNTRQRRFRWFGAAMKTVGKDRMEGDNYRGVLSDVLETIQRDVADMVGEEAVRPFSLRPLAQTQVDLQYRNGASTKVWVDIWPVTDTIGLAIAVPASSTGRDVRRFSNWTGNRGTGLSITTSIRMTPGHLGVLLGGGMGGRFLSALCPDPVLNLSTKKLNALRDRVLRDVLNERTTLFVLEGVHS